MRSGFWKADWFLGLIVVILFAALCWMSDLAAGLERKAYDLAVQSASRTPSEKVANIAIDKQSIDNIGRWPWPRAVGYLVFFSEPENERINRTPDALDYAHREGVVHRDVKPANLMYDPQTDTLKVTDFGIARLTASSKTVLAGRLPFDGESMAQLMFRIANEPPTDIRSLGEVPEGLVGFLDRALAKNPEERYQTGEHFGGALRAALPADVGRVAKVDLEI